MKKLIPALVAVFFLGVTVEANADLIEYVYVPYTTTGPTVSGVVWTDPSFDTLSGYLEITGYMYVDFSAGYGFAISPTSTFHSPPYLTPFVIAGFYGADSLVELDPSARFGPGIGAAVQGWIFFPDVFGAGYIASESGVGVWQPAEAVPDASSSAFLLLLGMSFVFGLIVSKASFFHNRENP